MSSPEGRNSRKNRSSRYDDDSEYSSSSVNSKQKYPYAATHNDDVSKKSTDHDVPYFNRIADDSQQRSNRTPDRSDGKGSLSTPLSSIDTEEWRCRECGFINEKIDKKCETCGTSKPIRPLLETRLSHTHRSPSRSPTNGRRFSPKETMYNRVGSPSLSRNREQSSHSDASEKSQDHYSRGRNQKQRSAKKSFRNRSSSSSSSNRSTSKHQTAGYSGGLYPTLPKDKDNTDDSSNHSSNNFEKDKYGTSSSKRSSSRSPSSKDHTRKESHSSVYKDKKHRSVIKKSKSPESSPDEQSSSCVATRYNEFDRSHAEANDEPRKKSTASDADSHKNKDKYRQTSPTEEKSSLYSTKSHSLSKEDNENRTASKISKRKEKPPSSSSSIPKISNRDNPFIVYIPDLPPNIDKDETLENMIRDCLKRRHKQNILDVRCNTQLGIGIVYLRTEEDKSDLIHDIKKIILETSNDTTVSFVDELELTSYVVIDTKDVKNLPVSSEVLQRWITLYKTKSEVKCEQLSVQFPNIFRITTNSLDELINSLSITEFSINNQIATVYYRANHCFFEDLPRTTTLDRLKEAIKNQISDRFMSKELIYIQYNKEGANAVVLTSGRARIWSLHSSISLDGKTFIKKDELACRVLIENVPKNLSPSVIKDHEIFAGSVINILSSAEHVILELSNREVYKKCIDRGALRIDDHVLGITTYTFSSNPEDSKIDAETWYETEMCNYLKSDITPFISDRQHPIFRWKWDSKAFLDQLHCWSSNDRNLKGKDQEKYEKLCNLKRHLLRMTVMLNTIGIVKKGYYHIGDKQIKIKSERLKTILYDHKSKLSHGKTISLSEATKFPYPSTLVKVVNEDCLLVYKGLIKQAYKPVLLNMANATSPGGGYKRGDGAQEETLFRRSNYYRSLDVTLDDDDSKSNARFYCNSNAEVEPLDEHKQLYPMDEFGAIYTSGLTFFRLPEDTGYNYMDVPIYDVCAIAMAAHRDPIVDKKNFLTSKFSISTRKKIESIFAIAYQHKHDCLVLSALGCGAFRNPPTHVALIFKSVIEQYAGFFKCIYFSIIDDHNAGQDFNPNGNYRPFRDVLDGLNIEPTRHKIIDMMIGPRKILNEISSKEMTLSDIRICYRLPCHHGGMCENITDKQHCREYTHPSLCPHTNSSTLCKERNDNQHMLWFQHRRKCFYGGECQLVENDRIHSNEFEHPIFCRDEGKCENMESNHLKSYRHVPICRYRRECVDFNRGLTSHCQQYRHCIPICRFGAFCVKFHDEKHFNEEKHPFERPCPFTPFHCRYYTALSESKNIKSLPPDTQNHCYKYSHVCRFGRQCQEKADIHWKTTIHIARHYCSHGDKCKRLQQENHLNSFSHPNISDIRLLCPYSRHECRERRNLEHTKKYQHYESYDRSGVITCFGQNTEINFVKNQENIIKTIKDHMKKSFTVSPDIQNLVKSLQPVHRCVNVIFESILVHGHVMSREYMKHLERPSFVAQAVQQHRHIRAIFDRYKMATIEGSAKDYILAIVSIEYKNKYNALAAGTASVATPITDTFNDYERNMRVQEKILRTTLKPEEITTIKTYAIDIATASWNLNHTPTGIGFPPDKKLGTDRHVFSVLGPNLGHYYGDIIIVFKNELMLHPDANFSPQAGTSFFSGSTFTQRRWTIDPGDENGRIQCFHESKLHPSIPGYEYAAAAELAAITGAHKKTMDVQLEDIFNRWKNIDSHQAFEAHLPQLVPLDYIEEIYIPKNLFDLLTPAAKESAKKIFRDSLHITPHNVNPTPAHIIGSRPVDKNRLDYQSYVVDKLIEKFERRMEHANHLYGTFITLAPSQFTNYIFLPLTINDAYNQYRRIHKHNSDSDATYIYWQAMYGDMMLTLSNEQISFDKDQPNIRCLVCYVAERPSTTTTTTYHESYSYLNAGDPYQHRMIMNNGRCLARSCSFYRGCNIADFLTYCLKIERKTGLVTLSHAGPNSIYCYETIFHQFSRSELDLNKLNYMHISAGSQKVPIRNLIVSFEQISDLHPTIDKNYTGNNDSGDPKKEPETRDQNRDEKSPSVVKQIIDGVCNFVGFNGNDKTLEPCPNSATCLIQDSKHRKEYSHPCPYGKNCRNKDIEQPYLTHPTSRIDPNDPCIPCRNEPNCRDHSSSHRMKYSHHEKANNKTSDRLITSSKAVAQHSSKHDTKLSDDTGKNDQRTPCRYGSDCHDQNDSKHCSQYSHPNDQRRRDDRTPCKFGNTCHDKDPHHRSKYSHK